MRGKKDARASHGMCRQRINPAFTPIYRKNVGEKCRREKHSDDKVLGMYIIEGGGFIYIYTTTLSPCCLCYHTPTSLCFRVPINGINGENAFIKQKQRLSEKRKSG